MAIDVRLYEDRGFYGRLPRQMRERMHDTPNFDDQGWQNKYEPESQSYYSRLSDGNYQRLPGSVDVLPDIIQGKYIIAMKQRVFEWNGTLPNRILSSDVERMERYTDVLHHVRLEHMLPEELHDGIRVYHSIEEIEEELRDRSDDMHIVDDAFHDDMNKGTVRRMKRLENENKHYKKQYEDYKKKYIGAGAKIKELNAEIERLKQFEPITVDPKLLSNKTDVTRRFATMDLM
jgi:hypothetical protein